MATRVGPLSSCYTTLLPRTLRSRRLLDRRPGKYPTPHPQSSRYLSTDVESSGFTESFPITMKGVLPSGTRPVVSVNPTEGKLEGSLTRRVWKCVRVVDEESPRGPLYPGREVLEVAVTGFDSDDFLG